MWESISRLAYDMLPQLPIAKRTIIVIKKRSPVLHSLGCWQKPVLAMCWENFTSVFFYPESPYFPLEVYTLCKCTKHIWKQFVLAVNLYEKSCCICMKLRAKKAKKIVRADNVFDTAMTITLDRFLWAGNAICLVDAESKEHCSPWKDCL